MAKVIGGFLEASVWGSWMFNSEVFFRRTQLANFCGWFVSTTDNFF